MRQTHSCFVFILGRRLEILVRQAYYYLSPDSESDLKIDTVPLTVNCAGISYCPLYHEFSKIRHDWQLIAVTNGIVELNMNGKLYTIEPNMYIIIEPETYYVQTSRYEMTSYYWIHFSGNNVAEILSGLNIMSNKVCEAQIDADIISMFSGLFKEFLIKDEKFDYMTASFCTQILGYLSRDDRKFTEYKYIGDSINYIYNNFNKDIDIKTLADIEHISVSRYRNLFKTQLGVTLTNFITSLRIDTACFYLKRSSMSISEIAESVGYSNQFYFTRIFKSKKGMSPTEYKKSF